MLSTADHHTLVPRTELANLEFRATLLDRVENNPQLQHGIAELCREDLLFYVNTFVYQIDPKKKDNKVGPFITWPFQDRAFLFMLWCIENDEDLLIEKSRQMGASWMMCILFNWLWQFHESQVLLFISRSEKAVEDESPNSLFWKLDFIHRYTPNWLMPGRGTKFRRRKLFYGNDEHDSSIFGEASTGKANVGGNTTAMAIDEFSQIDDDYEVLHRTSDSTGCRIFNGTHLGLDTAFYELSQRVDMKKLVMHWTQHPVYSQGLYRSGPKVEVLDKTYQYPSSFRFVMDGSPVGGPYPGLRSPWYDKQCERKGSPRAVAMDLDINPSGSVSQVFDPLLIRDLIAQYACPPYWQGDVLVDNDTGTVIQFIQRDDGPLKMWCHLDSNGRPPIMTHACAVDVSSGTGATNSCLTIVNVHGEKVVEFASPSIKAHEFAPLSVALCMVFRNEDEQPAQLIWEMQGPGAVFGMRVIELGFRNVYYRQDDTRMLAPLRSDKPGWFPSNDTKRVAIMEYMQALRSRQFLNRSAEALDECLYFKYSDNGLKIFHSGEMKEQDPSGAGVNHGDRVIPDALAWKLIKPLLQGKRKKVKDEVKIGSLAWRRQIHEVQARADTYEYG